MNKETIKLTLSMGINDFRTKYSGSAFGVIWAFIQPIITIVLYWIVFQYGLKAVAADPNTPYVVWLMSAMIPYLFLSEAINGVMNCFLEYNYLVKKLIFNVSILPIVKIIASLIVHVAFIGFILIISFACGTRFDLGLLQLLYYLVILIIYIVSIAYLLATVIVFFRDLAQIVNILLQVFMWATPILWPLSNISGGIRWVFLLNPIFYITEGYRDAITNTGVYFWNKPYQTIIFWMIVAINILVSRNVYKKLKAQLAEVL